MLNLVQNFSNFKGFLGPLLNTLNYLYFLQDYPNLNTILISLN